MAISDCRSVAGPRQCAWVCWRTVALACGGSLAGGRGLGLGSRRGSFGSAKAVDVGSDSAMGFCAMRYPGERAACAPQHRATLDGSRVVDQDRNDGMLLPRHPQG